MGWRGFKGFKTLNLTGLEPMVVESLRTLKAENDMLRDRSLKLEDRVKALEANRRLSTAGLGDSGLSIFGFAMMAGAFVLYRRAQTPKS
jgi:hypothetical protein